MPAKKRTTRHTEIRLTATVERALNALSADNPDLPIAEIIRIAILEKAERDCDDFSQCDRVGHEWIVHEITQRRSCTVCGIDE